MPTPMHVYNEMVAIGRELLERDGESVMSDQWIDFNLNSNMRVKLTDVGRMRYREFHARFGMDRSPQEDADGWYRCQMHELMQIRGDMTWNGNSALPFSTNVQLWFGDTP